MSERGNDYLLTITDKLTKFVRLTPCTKQVTAEMAAEMMLRVALTTFGRIPTSIISDRDPRFTADVWAALWRLVGTTLKMTTAHRPQADGQSERTNRSTLEMLRAAIGAEAEQWDAPTTLAQTEFALNAHIAAATGMSPFELLTGRKPIFPAATTSTNQQRDGTIPEDAHEWATRMLNRWSVARERVMEAGDAMVPDMRTRKPTTTFTAGEKVLVHTRNYPRMRPNKLAPAYVGPFVVKRVLSPSTVELQLDSSALKHIHPVINADALKKYVDSEPGTRREDDGNGEQQTAQRQQQTMATRRDQQRRPTTTLRNARGQEMFVVKEFVDERRRRGKTTHLKVRWDGYDAKHDSWEPISKMRQFDILLKDFRRERRRGQQE